MGVSIYKKCAMPQKRLKNTPLLGNIFATIANLDQAWTHAKLEKL